MSFNSYFSEENDAFSFNDDENEEISFFAKQVGDFSNEEVPLIAKNETLSTSNLVTKETTVEESYFPSEQIKEKIRLQLQDILLKENIKKETMNLKNTNKFKDYLRNKKNNKYLLQKEEKKFRKDNMAEKVISNIIMNIRKGMNETFNVRLAKNNYKKNTKGDKTFGLNILQKTIKEILTSKNSGGNPNRKDGLFQRDTNRTKKQIDALINQYKEDKNKLDIFDITFRECLNVFNFEKYDSSNSSFFKKFPKIDSFIEKEYKEYKQSLSNNEIKQKYESFEEFYDKLCSQVLMFYNYENYISARGTKDKKMNKKTKDKK